jgi:hypothetical protein
MTKSIKYAEAIYQTLPDDIKGSAKKALRWAKNRLILLDGDGWCLYLYRNSKGIKFSLSKPRWAADYCGEPRSTGAEAIIMTVLEYENGF